MSMSWLWDIGFPIAGVEREGSEGNWSFWSSSRATAFSVSTAETVSLVIVSWTMMADVL